MALTLAVVFATVFFDQAVRHRLAVERSSTALLERLTSPCYQYRIGNDLAPPIPCSDRHAVDGVPVVEVSGLLTWGFEVLVIRPCDSSVVWWVWFDPCTSGGQQIRALIGSAGGSTRPSRTLFVKLRGRLSRPSSCGHLGAYERLFLVQDVLSARLPTTRDCHAPRPGSSNPGVQWTRCARH